MSILFFIHSKSFSSALLRATIIVIFVITALSILTCKNSREENQGKNVHPDRPQVLKDQWKSVQSVSQLWNNYPEISRNLIAQLDLTNEGLKKVQDHLQKGDTIQGLQSLVRFYRNVDRFEWLLEDTKQASEVEIPTSNDLLSNVFTFQNVRDTLPVLGDGSVYWRHYGPRNDKEWCYFLNRHYYFIPLLKAWNDSGNDQYVNKFDSLIRDWVLHNPPPKNETHKATWRILEVGLRMASTWPKTFYGFVKSPDFSPAGVLLMLSRIPDHAEYIKKCHENYNNRAAMELGGLGIAAMMFPEFRNSDEWLSYSKDRMLVEIREQVYPDGVQDELTSHYHWVALRHFYRFARYVDQTGVELFSEEYFSNLERMFNYVAYVLRPDGSNPLNNDSDRDTLLNWVSRGADFFDRPDWRWIATGGKKGTRPEDLPSSVFPWAGQLVMKNNWSKDAHWAFFDIGPWGTGHQHEDKLHISIHAHGRDILVDAGRFAYIGEVAEKFRGPYATHSRGHNVLLIDGSGQNPGPREAESPLEKEQYRITPEFDYARSSYGDFDVSGGDVSHTRAVFYVKNCFWLVADRVESETPREITALWHYHPDCRVAETGDGFASVDSGKGNIRIDPLGRKQWDRSIVKGQEEPVIQGWYSVEYNKYRPSPAALFNSEDVHDETFVWLLLPSEGTTPEYDAEIESSNRHQVTVRVEMADGTTYRVTVPLDDQVSPTLVQK